MTERSARRRDEDIAHREGGGERGRRLGPIGRAFVHHRKHRIAAGGSGLVPQGLAKRANPGVGDHEHVVSGLHLEQRRMTVLTAGPRSGMLIAGTVVGDREPSTLGRRRCRSGGHVVEAAVERARDALGVALGEIGALAGEQLVNGA